MCLVLPLDTVHNQETACCALEGPNIQQGFQKGPWGAHSCKEGRPHLGIGLASYADNDVPEDGEMAYQLGCSLQ